VAAEQPEAKTGPPPLTKPAEVLAEEAIIQTELSSPTASKELRTAMIRTCKYRLQQFDTGRYDSLKDVVVHFPYLLEANCVRAGFL